MLPNLESWDMHVLDTIVDKVQKKVVLRVRYEMRVRGYVGEEGVVQNEVEWWLEMDEDGGRVRSSREVVDGVAAGRIGELVRGRKEGGRRGEVS